jgi:DNA (cytosine-5)-methyltransferase 1
MPDFVSVWTYHPTMSFRFIDLFSGIGGFHAALSALGGECVMASEIDASAVNVYKANWGIEPLGDITELANEQGVSVPDHDVLVGGFPCQPFSKSGYQRGMDEARGTLFWNIARIIEEKKPKIVLLENVRNIAGPRHTHEWDVIIRTLRENGYRVSSIPFIVSPHQIRRDFGGRPQVRERVLIAATRLPKGTRDINVEPGLPDLKWAKANWSQNDWDLHKDLPLQRVTKSAEKAVVALSDEETSWIDAWDDFVRVIKKVDKTSSVPGFPICVDAWPPLGLITTSPDLPEWKQNFIEKNVNFYMMHKKVLDKWLSKWKFLEDFPPSRRKFEWQAQDAETLWDCIMHLRPSGIRAKRPTYVPALVAITQTSIVGKNRASKRRLTVREGARLQGFPEWFNFYDQKESASFKQLGNAVNVGVIFQVMKAVVSRDYDLLGDAPELLKAITTAPHNPDLILSNRGNLLHGPNRIQVVQEELILKLVN